MNEVYLHSGLHTEKGRHGSYCIHLDLVSCGQVGAICTSLKLRYAPRRTMASNEASSNEEKTHLYSLPNEVAILFLSRLNSGRQMMEMNPDFMLIDCRFSSTSSSPSPHMICFP